MDRALRPTLLAAAGLAVILTVLVWAVPVDVAYRAPEGHVVVDTAASVTALMVSFIVLGRFLERGGTTDLLLAAALAILGATNLVYAAVPAAIGASITRWTTWAPLGGRLVAGVLLAAAALIPESVIRRPRTLLVPFAAGVLALVALLGVAFAFIAPHLELGIDPAMAPRPGTLHVVGNEAVLALQLVMFVLYAVTSIAFLGRAERSDDRLMGWVSIAAALGAVASLNYFLFPSLFSEWVYVGDFLRLAFAVVLLIGAATEVQRYQRELAAAAASEERRRLARELHDGLAQELAFIATQTRAMSRRSETPISLDNLAVAAERALDESRSAISALTRPMDEPLDSALAQAAEEVAGRVGARVRLDLQEGIRVSPATREGLVRIVREAVSNSVRHGKATSVSIRLSDGDGVRVRVDDDGIGFDTSQRDGHGFGLTSMRERARAIGGELRLQSTPEGGTQVEVVIP